MWLEDQIRKTAIRQSIALGGFVALICYTTVARFRDAVLLLGGHFPNSSRDWGAIGDAFAYSPGPVWGVILAILTGLALYGLSRTIPAALDPASGRIARLLRAAQPRRSLQEISQQLEAEYTATPRDHLPFGKDHYFLVSPLGLDIRPLDDLVWCYPVKKTTYAFRLIPVSRSYSIKLYFKNGDTSAPISKAVLERLIVDLVAKRPWIMVGHDKRVEKAWRHGRSRILSAFEAHKASFGRAS